MVAQPYNLTFNRRVEDPSMTKEKGVQERGQDQPDLTFEQALEQLEEIVNRMRAEELPLQQALESYERGKRLASFCQERLDAAKQRLEILNEGDDGTLLLHPAISDGAAVQAAEPDAQMGKRDDSDEIPF